MNSNKRPKEWRLTVSLKGETCSPHWYISAAKALREYTKRVEYAKSVYDDFEISLDLLENGIFTRIESHTHHKEKL